MKKNNYIKDNIRVIKMGLIIHKCKNCGKQFEDYAKTTKYCSRQCYLEYISTHNKYGSRNCPICGREFKLKYETQTFCSVECRTKSTENKIQCICDYCGKPFNRIVSEVISNKRHYCSVGCKRLGMYWSPLDTEILVNNFGKMSYSELVNLMSNGQDVECIKRRVAYLHLTSPRKWSKKDMQILRDSYSTKPISEVMELLSHHSLFSIMGQAKAQQIKSYFYLTRMYTDTDDEYLKNNYLTTSDEELAMHMGRTEKAVKHRLWILGLHRPSRIDGYKNLIEYTRRKIYPWREQVRREANYTCAITGNRSNIIVHHIRGFNLLFNEVIENLDFPIYDDICQYTQSQLDCFVDTFLQVQEMYGEYVCITEDVHKQFHNQYGYGNNTKEQWEDFLNKYYK